MKNDSYNNNNYNNNNYCMNQNLNRSPYSGANPNPDRTTQKKTKSRFGIGIVVGVLITIAVLMTLAVAGVFLYIRGMRTGTTDLNYQEKLDTIQQYLDTYYLGELDEQAVEDSLASGLVSATGDKYAQYYTKEEFDRLMEDQSGSYSGIGVSIVENEDGEIEIYKVFNGSPAEEAGIQVKDVIVEANGVRDFEDIDELVSLVRGETGTSVDLVVKRAETEIPVTVERRNIEMETVNYEMLDNNIGYIELVEFDTVSVEQFNKALEDLESQGMTSLILDLRDNPGGDYDTVIAMSDRVLPAGNITTVINNKGKEKTETSDDEHKITIPMAVLINENSASASELFTGAIKDYGIATLIGETTYGKGIIQSIYRLPDGSGMKFTTEEYLTPKGNHINGIGVSPDIEVSIPEEAYEDGEVTKEEDTQLQKAIEVLLGEETAVAR